MLLTPLFLPRRFFRQAELRAELLQPGKPAVPVEPSATGARTAFSVPRLDPWGIVVVSPRRGRAGE